ncbi:MAG: hypothetical protein M0R06_22360 [Sphaerochaeta sp.]|jgi:hypothetical protein|nr:hypothetical protein [Sphaerochaeta sp.]
MNLLANTKNENCPHKEVEIILERHVTAILKVNGETSTLSVQPDSFTDEEPVDFICLECGANLSGISEIIGL